jgi:hypothetical protein
MGHPSISVGQRNASDWMMSAIVWCCFFAVFVSCDGIIQSTDSKYVIPSAMSLVTEGNLDVKEFFIHSSGRYQPSDYHLDQIGENYYNRYPIAQVLLIAPFVAALTALGDLSLQSDLRYYRGIELIIACAIAAGCCVLMFRIAVLGLDTRRALIVTLVFGLGTSVWSTASRGFWQHGPSVFCLTLALLMLLQAEARPRLISMIAITLALSYVIRPTNAIPVGIFTLYILWKYPQQFPKYLLASGLVAVPFFCFNMYLYGFPLSPYYTPGTLGIPRHQGEALAGLLFSPSRGIFVFSPVLLFSMYGIALKLANKSFSALDFSIVLIFVGHLAAVAFSNPMWWGGHSFGPRFMTEMAPFLVYFLIPLFQYSQSWSASKATILWGLFTATLVLSCFIHYSGAASSDAWAWNVKPTNIDQNLERLWDWKDSQALRSLGVWLEKCLAVH